MMNTLSQMCLEDVPSKVERVKIETLVTIMVHCIEITREIKCKDVNDFDWQKQTRMKWDTDID